MEFLTEDEGKTLNDARKLLTNLRRRAATKYFNSLTSTSEAWDLGRVEHAWDMAEHGIFEALNSTSAYLSDEVASKFAVHVGSDE